MGSREHYGHTYVYGDGKARFEKLKRKQILYYFYVENDGARFLRRGPETEVVIKIGKNATEEELENIVKSMEIEPFVRRKLKAMIETGKRQESYSLDG